MQYDSSSSRLTGIWLVGIGLLAALLVFIGGGSAQAQGKDGGKTTKPGPDKAQEAQSAQVISSSPLTITVGDDTRMDIHRLGERQFYGDNAEGTYIWTKVGGTVKVYGPSSVPAGNSTNTYSPVLNNLSGTGTPADPWVIITQVQVPDTHLQITQRTSYVAGAEYTRILYTVEQIGASTPVTVTLFHAADLYTAGSDSGYGYYDASDDGVGDYFTRTNGLALYQQFIPNPDYQMPNAYQEANYSTIWDNIGSTSGPGPGFNNTIISDTLHDSGAGLQWNLTIPASGTVTIGDTDLFGGVASLCGSFIDVPEGSFYYQDIAYLACHGYVSGYADGTFRPQNNTTRAQLAKIIVLGEGWNIDTSGGPHFTDVPANNPFYTFVETAFHHNVISGYADGNFRWQNDVTRGQIAKIVVNAEGWATDTSGGPHFRDVSTTNTFYSYIETAYHHGIISGYTVNGNQLEFREGNNATRGQVSKIVHLALTQ